VFNLVKKGHNKTEAVICAASQHSVKSYKGAIQGGIVSEA